MSVCPSVRTEQLGSHWTDFREIWYMNFFSEIFRKKIKFHYNLTIIMDTLHEDQNKFWQHLAQFFTEWEMFQTKIAEKIKTHILR